VIKTPDTQICSINHNKTPDQTPVKVTLMAINKRKIHSKDSENKKLKMKAYQNEMPKAIKNTSDAPIIFSKNAYAHAEHKDIKRQLLLTETSVFQAPVTETPEASCHPLLNQNDSDPLHPRHTGSQLRFHELQPEQQTSAPDSAPRSATRAPAKMSDLLQTICHSPHLQLAVSGPHPSS
jgi:hypothetical protein